MLINVVSIYRWDIYKKYRQINLGLGNKLEFEESNRI